MSKSKDEINLKAPFIVAAVLMVMYIIAVVWSSLAEGAAIPEVKAAPSITVQQMQCKAFRSAAMAENRAAYLRYADEDEGEYVWLPSKKTPSKNGSVVLKETIDECGVITQSIDKDGDGEVDAILAWRPLDEVVVFEGKPYILFELVTYVDMTVYRRNMEK